MTKPATSMTPLTKSAISFIVDYAVDHAFYEYSRDRRELICPHVSYIALRGVHVYESEKAKLRVLRSECMKPYVIQIPTTPAETSFDFVFLRPMLGLVSAAAQDVKAHLEEYVRVNKFIPTRGLQPHTDLMQAVKGIAVRAIERELAGKSKSEQP